VLFLPSVLGPSLGRKALQAQSVICDHGRWRGAVCSPRTCDSPPPPAPHVTGLGGCAGLASGKECHTARCTDDSGFMLIGRPRCAQGKWNMSVVRCVDKRCDLVPHGPGVANASNCAGMRSGELCRIRCVDPSQEAVPPELMCDRGQWLPKGLLPDCMRRCAAAQIAITDSVNIQRCDSTVAGGRCTVRCTVGHAASGELQCGARGRWNATDGVLPFCHPVADGRAPAYVEQALLVSSWPPAAPHVLRRGASRLRGLLAVALGQPFYQLSIVISQAIEAPQALVMLRVMCRGAATPGDACHHVRSDIEDLVAQRMRLENAVLLVACVSLCGVDAQQQGCRSRCSRRLPLKVRHRPFERARVKRLAHGYCGTDTS